jgi:DNA-binding CsgD family transcriptional regulator
MGTESTGSQPTNSQQPESGQKAEEHRSGATPDVVRGREVSLRVVRAMASALSACGVDAASLQGGLSFCLGEPESGAERIAWDEFAVFAGRAEIAAGGAAEFQELCGVMISEQRVLRALAGLVVRPRDLYLLCPRICRSAYRIPALRVDVLPDESIRMECRIPHEYQDCPAFFRAASGILRVLPRFVGAPDAIVEVEIAPRHAVHYVVPPPSATIAARFSRALDGALANVLPVLATSPESAAADMGTLVDLADDGRAVEYVAHTVGPRFASHSSIDELARDVLRVLREHLCSHSAALWVRSSANDPLALVASFGSAGAIDTMISHEFSLSVGGSEVGRLETDLPTGNLEEHRRLVRSLVPWISLGILHVARSRADDAARASRARQLAAEWRLTPTESRVFELVLRGLSTQEAARALGCSPRTVEVHVGRLLRKSGCATRAALVAWWHA